MTKDDAGQGPAGAKVTPRLVPLLPEDIAVTDGHWDAGFAAPAPSVTSAIMSGSTNAAGTTPPGVTPKRTIAAADRVRVPVRLHPDVAERLKYWAQKHGVSVNEYVAEAVDAAIARENSDYDLPTLEIARLGQLNDLVKSLSVDVQNLSSVVVASQATFISLSRGDSYLGDEESGEMD